MERGLEGRSGLEILDEESAALVPASVLEPGEPAPIGRASPAGRASRPAVVGLWKMEMHTCTAMRMGLFVIIRRSPALLAKEMKALLTMQSVLNMMTKMRRMSNTSGSTLLGQLEGSPLGELRLFTFFNTGVGA